MSHFAHIALLAFFILAIGFCIFGFLVILAALFTGDCDAEPWDDGDDG
jgi:hypothetical protein